MRSIAKTFQDYKHLVDVLPAMGYGDKQIADLEETINATPCDLVMVGTPIDLTRLLKINKTSARVTYDLKEKEPELMRSMIEQVAKKGQAARSHVTSGSVATANG